MQETNVSWLPFIPSGWRMASAGMLFSESTKLASDALPVLTPSKDFGVVTRERYSELSGHRPNENFATNHLMRMVLPGQFIITMGSFESGLEYSRSSGKITPHYRVLTATHDCDHGYFRWLFKSPPFIDGLARLATEIRKGQEINFNKFSRLRLPLPPLPTQRCIADYLDRETAEIDAMDAELDRLVETLRERLTITTEQTYGRLAHLDGPLGAVLVRQWSGKSVNGHPVAASDGEVGVLKTSAVSSGVFQSRENKLVVERDMQLVQSPVCAGDVLVGRANSPDLVGVSALVLQNHPNLYLSDKIWGLHLDCDPAYFVHWTRTQRYRTQVRETLVGASSSMQNLSFVHFSRFRMPLPALDEQHRIAAELDEQTARIDDMIADANRLKGLLAERRSTLITEVVTGAKEVPA